MNSYKWPLVAACGKFQPFHSEHLEYVERSASVGEHVIIGITNPDPVHTKEEATDTKRSTVEANPFTYYERYLMVVENLRELRIDPLRYDIVPFPINVPEVWFNYIPKGAVFLITLYEEDPWLTIRKNKLEAQGIVTEVLWSKTTKGIEGTEVRKMIRSKQDWESLVPKATARVIRSLGLDKRLQNNL